MCGWGRRGSLVHGWKAIENGVGIHARACECWDWYQSCNKPRITSKCRLSLGIICATVDVFVESVWTSHHGAYNNMRVRCIYISPMPTLCTTNPVSVGGDGRTSVMNLLWVFLTIPDHVAHVHGIVPKDVIKLHKTKNQLQLISDCSNFLLWRDVLWIRIQTA